jgi:hypothetical protein
MEVHHFQKALVAWGPDYSLRTSGPRSASNQKLLELARIGGLGHMHIEPRLEGCLPARVIRMSDNGHKGRRGKALELAECPDQLVPVPCPWQSDVTQNAATIRLAGVYYLPGFNSGCRCE